MPVSETPGSGQNPSLFSSLQSFWAVLIAILYTRLDLATVELEEIGTHTVQLIVVTLAALAAILMTVFFLLFFLVVTFWEHAVFVLGAVTAVSLLISVSLVLAARALIRNRPKFLAQTLAELRRDVEGIRPDLTQEPPKP